MIATTDTMGTLIHIVIELDAYGNKVRP